MPKRRRTSPKKRSSQHAKFVEAARRLGIAEGEGAFKDALKKIAPNRLACVQVFGTGAGQVSTCGRQ